MKILYILLLILVFTSVVEPFFASSLVSYQPVTLPPKYYEYYPINVTSGQCLFFHVNTSALATIMLFNQNQFNIFEKNSSGTPIFFNVSDNVSYKVGPLSTDTYYIVVLNNVTNNTINVNTEYSLVPYNVYNVRSSLPAPIGIADYGVYNISNTLKGTITKYDEAIGYVTIYNISAFNSTPPEGVNRSGASLQLNSVLQINTNNGSYQFWLQNVIGFITSERTYYVEDNIWNFTSNVSYLTNSSVNGKGSVFPYKNEFYYAYGTNYYNYTFPLSMILYIKVEGISSEGVTISFGYNNGSGIQWYDNATINVANVKSTYLLIDDYNVTGSQLYYDLELVFAGQANGEYTYFKSMNASLGLQIILLNGTLITPENFYTFGSDTEESADNLITIFKENQSWVLIGNDNFYNIGNTSIPKFYLHPLSNKNISNASSSYSRSIIPSNTQQSSNATSNFSMLTYLLLFVLFILVALGIKRLRRR
ncbi:thermopsin [Acidianus brierleyi]|nr:thermopsin [Acidianus brierleyi]